MELNTVSTNNAPNKLGAKPPFLVSEVTLVHEGSIFKKISFK
jgi:hypothetical protein